jgi:hypothetical protein
MESSDLQRITSWLIDGAWSSKAPAEMTAEACERMVAAGLPGDAGIRQKSAAGRVRAGT